MSLINNMEDLYRYVTGEFLSYVIRKFSNESDWKDFAGCEDGTDVWKISDELGELDWVYDSWSEIMYDVVRANHTAVWNLLKSELTEDQMWATAKEYGYEDISDSEQFIYELVQQYYINNARNSAMWWDRIQNDYVDTVVEILKNLGMM